MGGPVNDNNQFLPNSEGEVVFDRYKLTFHKDSGLVVFKLKKLFSKFQQSDDEVIQFQVGTGKYFVIQPNCEEHTLENIHLRGADTADALQKWMSSMKPKIYGVLTGRQDPDTQESPTRYAFGTTPAPPGYTRTNWEAEFERNWSLMLMFNLNRKVIDASATTSEKELLISLMQTYYVPSEAWAHPDTGA